MPHIIDRVKLELTVSSAEQAYPVQQQCSELFDGQIKSIIARVCRSLLGESEFLILDTLFLDLGKIESRHVKQSFIEAFTEQFQTQLSKEISQHRVDSASTVRDKAKTDSTKQPSNKLSDNQNSASDSAANDFGEINGLRDKHSVFVKSLCHFLATGALPWYANYQTSSDLEQNISDLANSSSLHQRTKLAEQLIKQLSSEQSVLRLVNQLRFSAQQQLYQLLFKDQLNWQWLFSMLSASFDIQKSGINKQTLWHVLWKASVNNRSFSSIAENNQDTGPEIMQTLFAFIMTQAGNSGVQKSSASSTSFISRLILELASANSPCIKTKQLALKELDLLANVIAAKQALNLERDLTSGEQATKLAGPANANQQSYISTKREVDSEKIARYSANASQSILFRKFSPALSPIRNAKPLETPNAKTARIPNFALLNWRIDKTSEGLKINKTNAKGLLQANYTNEFEGRNLALEKGLPADLTSSLNSDSTSENTELTLQISNAGTVIFWPYLGKLFKTLSLIENNQFISQAHQQKAIYLLGYLVSGQTNLFEHQLLLNKILCDWPIDRPLNRFVETSNAEKQECEALLKTVINHWSILGNTSIESLRESFLMRSGRLKQSEHGWLLQVESGPFDMLIDKLPWGLSMIKLSWMQTLLQVEWRYG